MNEWHFFYIIDIPIGVSILSTVRNATRLAVYEDIKIKVKNHHTAPTILPDSDLMGIIQWNTY